MTKKPTPLPIAMNIVFFVLDLLAARAGCCSISGKDRPRILSYQGPKKKKKNPNRHPYSIKKITNTQNHFFKYIKMQSFTNKDKQKQNNVFF